MGISKWMTWRAVMTVGAVYTAFFLAGCSDGGGSGGSASSTAASSQAKKAKPLTCAQLNGLSIPAGEIGLPTTGAVVTATQTIAASGTGFSALGAYCLVSGSIMPVDPTAPNIDFQLALPAQWNSKTLMIGGGGFDGTIPAVAGNLQLGPTNALLPLGRGYAVFGSDSGHQDPTGGGSFSVNQEAYNNFAGDALKKTRDTSLYLVRAFYARNPVRQYFAGGSTGGRESLTVIQRWPQDWDGAIALYPAWNFTELTLQQLNATEAFAAPGAYLDTAKRTVLFNAALQACDALDGASDGIISNVLGCYQTFNPATATYNGVALRCPGGVDTGDTCLSDAQIAALTTMDSPLIFNYPLASGQTSYPGYNVFIADTGINNPNPAEAIVTSLALGSVQPSFPLPAGTMFDGVISDQFIRYTVADNTSLDSLTFNASNPGAFASRLSDLSSLDAINPDLTPFASKGGKLLIAHGTADLTVATRATEYYFQLMQANMGVDSVDNFVRFYEIPGLQHAFSTVFNASWDQLTALENWVERGIDPATNQIVTDTIGVPGRTRPLCRYPSWPKYNGSGDINAAASFTCVMQ
ncbi:MAG: tannase/feruloyl esterase family alpha/beta hydrolase [Burkholderiaceae bacterium]|jgi:feruloyl esterase